MSTRCRAWARGLAQKGSTAEAKRNSDNRPNKMNKTSVLQQPELNTLEFFDIVNVQERLIRNEDFCHLAEVRGLKEISVSSSFGLECSLTYEFVEHLNLESIQMMRFNHLPLGDDFFFALENKRQQGELNKLEYFQCAIGCFTDLSVIHAISKWTSLRGLVLASTNLIGNELAQLKSLYQLETLFLRYPGATSDTGESLKSLMGNCNIFIHDLALLPQSNC